MVATGGWSWREAAEIFDQRADAYNDWFRDNPVYAAELAAVRRVAGDLPGPALEVGVGPGVFARDLGIFFGIDPAWQALGHARRRGIAVVRAIGEDLPVKSGSLGAVFLLFALCFMPTPARVLAECRRVLRAGGSLVIGMIPAASSWGRELAERGRQGDLFYRQARFFDPQVLVSELAHEGFVLAAAVSTLASNSGRESFLPEQPVDGIVPGAGFVVCRFHRRQTE